VSAAPGPNLAARVSSSQSNATRVYENGFDDDR